MTMTKVLKNIKVSQSNNKFLDETGLKWYGQFMPCEALKTYVENFINLEFESDIYGILKILNWVSNQWSHDGENNGETYSSLEILKKAHEGESFTCQAYGKVISEILKATGVISRKVFLKSLEGSNDLSNNSHDGLEVWSNQLKKWVFIDTQFSVYFKYEDVFLNFNEIHHLIKNKTFSPEHIFLDETLLEGMAESVEVYKEEYYDFIINYMASISTFIVLNSKVQMLQLFLNSDHEILSFQDLTDKPFLSTHKSSDFYVELNQTAFTFSLKEALEFKDEEAYLEKNHASAAMPRLEIQCFHNMPRFSGFEVAMNDEDWHSFQGTAFDYILREGLNTLSVRAINKEGVKGLTAFTQFVYGDA